MEPMMTGLFLAMLTVLVLAGIGWIVCKILEFLEIIDG